MNRTSKNQFQYIQLIRLFGPAAGIITFGITSQHNPSITETSILSILIAFLIDRLVDSFIGYYSSTEFERHLNSIKHEVRNTFSITYVGRSNEINHVMHNELMRCTLVRNVFLCNDVNPFNSDVLEDDISNLYNTLFSNSPTNIWHDIVTENAASLKRFAKIKPQRDGQYQATVIPDNIISSPSFVIFYPKGDPPIVFFGWIYHPDVMFTDIYMSSEKNLVIWYEKYYDLLRNMGEKRSLITSRH